MSFQKSSDFSLNNSSRSYRYKPLFFNFYLITVNFRETKVNPDVQTRDLEGKEVLFLAQNV